MIDDALKLRTFKPNQPVQAEVIVRIGIAPNVLPTDRNALLTLASGSTVVVSGQWMEKYHPQASGYLIAYADGNYSFAPAQVFDSSHTELQR